MDTYWLFRLLSSFIFFKGISCFKYLKYAPYLELWRFHNFAICFSKLSAAEPENCLLFTSIHTLFHGCVSTVKIAIRTVCTISLESWVNMQENGIRLYPTTYFYPIRMSIYLRFVSLFYFSFFVMEKSWIVWHCRVRRISWL